MLCTCDFAVVFVDTQEEKDDFDAAQHFNTAPELVGSSFPAFSVLFSCVRVSFPCVFRTFFVSVSHFSRVSWTDRHFNRPTNDQLKATKLITKNFTTREMNKVEGAKAKAYTELMERTGREKKLKGEARSHWRLNDTSQRFVGP